jgi:rubredoxin
VGPIAKEDLTWNRYEWKAVHYYVIIFNIVLMFGPSHPLSSMNTEEAVQPEELDQYECRSCGYVYEPEKGDGRKLAPGTAFTEVPLTWRCPVCGAKPTQFSNIGPKGTASGFKENYGFGFGANTLTGAQKNVLIFSALALGFIFFLSLYGLR